MRLPLSSLYVLLAISIPTSYAQESSQAPLAGDDYVCEDPPYRVHMVSQSPLVMYITDFLTERERSHLLAITKDTFSHSAITGTRPLDQRIRTSQSAGIPPRADAAVSCIEDRALRFQGLLDLPRTRLEPIQLVRYGEGEHFHFHTDWYMDPALAGAEAGGNRETSFFAYVQVENGTVGGGTGFPMVDAPDQEPEGWCEFVDCDEEWERGVTFRPVEGNAVFWVNLLPDGRGDTRTLHAGLPVLRGGKVGMNIWTRQGGMYRGDD